MSVRRAGERKQCGREDEWLSGTGVVVGQDLSLISEIVAQASQHWYPEDREREKPQYREAQWIMPPYMHQFVGKYRLKLLTRKSLFEIARYENKRSQPPNSKRRTRKAGHDTKSGQVNASTLCGERDQTPA